MKTHTPLAHFLKMADGPGQVGHLQVAIINVTLRSQYDPSGILGRPTVVGMTGNWGHFLYGLSFTLAPTPQTIISLALDAALTNKMQFCDGFGTVITAGEWPVEFLPKTILADRGLATSLVANRITRGLGIQFAYAPAQQPSLGALLKPFLNIVGKSQTNPSDTSTIPAMVEKRCSATNHVMTAREFQQLLIQAALNHNQSLLSNYALTSQMIRDGVTPRPIELLTWGLANLAGTHHKIRKVAPERARLYLLSDGIAKVTCQGICFRGLHYICDRALHEKWFQKARNYRGFKIQVAYDPRFVNSIYLPNSKDAGFDQCSLAKDDHHFQGLTWEEHSSCSKAHRANAIMEQVAPHGKGDIR